MSKFINDPNLIAIKGNSLTSARETDALIQKLPSKSLPGKSILNSGKIPPNAKIANLGKAVAVDIPDGQKRTAIPVRVEPKVFFANERTFLSWLNFSILLGTISLGLVNFGDSTIRVAGIAFSVFSLLVMLYSLYLYQTRATMILNRDPGPYVLLNFYIRFSP
ncbi:hypothetical protein BB560_005498 [Smittium megazygosporum]|uniref:DUF202 domain-containing protein n=1 Tax=Smittium megazygosporum TaxID=133381 RepID=A0A2T9Z4B8_9FUNG|nr:hypothetical protein BB560_005498 [Smittium megazygosporum]